MLTTDQWITIFTSFIGALIGGGFTLAGVYLGARIEKNKQTKIKYQENILEMQYFNDTIETIVDSVCTLTFTDQFYENDLESIDKAYDKILKYTELTSKIDFKLSLLLGELARKIFECRTTLKSNLMNQFKNHDLPDIEALTKRIIQRHNEIRLS